MLSCLWTDLNTEKSVTSVLVGLIISSDNSMRANVGTHLISIAVIESAELLFLLVFDLKVSCNSLENDYALFLSFRLAAKFQKSLI